MEFFPSAFVVKDRLTGVPLAHGKCSNGVYHLRSPSYSLTSATHFSTLGLHTNLQMWRSRLGNPSGHLSTLVVSQHKLHLLNKFDMSEFNWDSCYCCKTHKLPFNTSTLIDLHPLHYIYVDIWGPTPILVDGYQFYLLLVDSFTRYCWLFPMSCKSQVRVIFEIFYPLVECQFGYNEIFLQ